jgi:superfamily I DNA/RNA helicase
VQQVLAALRAGRSDAPPADRAVLARVRRAAAGAGVAALDLEALEPLAARCGEDLDRFLAELALGAQVDTWDPRADRVSLLTLHASKGLEFPVVFVVGCEDGLLPLRVPGRDGGPNDEPATRATAAEAAIAEERRLFFVGLTRARDRLFVSHVRRRRWRGTDRDMPPSRFFDAIDPRLFEDRGEAAPRRPRDQQLRLL